ncbi:MAG: helix-turn-helix transcriptional regulator [Clostridia bacterium]|nr:helix-turn-helix transcriptional regulator [Clostridia bacterium]
MDQVKIGKFIAERRKLLGLTQIQLGEKLAVTDRAVSKWETGRTMPDSSIMLELCSLLKISVTDLLTGEIVTMENKSSQLEKELLEMLKQKEEHDKSLLTLEWVIGGLSLIVLFIPIILGAYLPMKDWQRILVVFSGFIPCFVGVFFTVKIEQIAGYYECKECGYRYVPTYKSVNLSMHLGRTRFMKCPNCGKKSWQKKVIKKQD